MGVRTRYVGKRRNRMSGGGITSITRARQREYMNTYGRGGIIGLPCALVSSVLLGAALRNSVPDVPLGVLVGVAYTLAIAPAPRTYIQQHDDHSGGHAGQDPSKRKAASLFVHF